MHETFRAMIFGNLIGLGVCLCLAGLIYPLGMASAGLCAAGVFLGGVGILGCIEIRHGRER
jgi:hypothetical protein